MIKIKKPIATLKKNEETTAGPKKQPRKCNPQKKSRNAKRR